MRVTLAIAVFALLPGVAACDEQAPLNLQEMVGYTSAAERDAQLRQMSEGDRNPVLLEAVQAAGRQCSRVLSAAPSTPIYQTPTWRVWCEEGPLDLAIVAGGELEVLNNPEPQNITETDFRNLAAEGVGQQQ